MNRPITVPITAGLALRITVEVIPAEQPERKPTSLAEFLGQPEPPEKPPATREPRRRARNPIPGESWL